MTTATETTPKARKPRKPRGDIAVLPSAQTTPSRDIVHSAVFANELRVRLAGFDAGLMALQAERETVQTRHEEERAAAEREHESRMLELAARIADMEAGRNMALRGLGEDPLRQPEASENAS